jgi:hypothetical protein
VECVKAMLWMPHKSIMALDLKSWAYFVTHFLGQLNLAKILVSKKFIITLLVAFLVGTTSIHLVNYSVEVGIHLCFPLEGGFI